MIKGIINIGKSIGRGILAVINWIKEVIFKIVYEEYELTVWFEKDTTIDTMGNMLYTRTPKVWLLKKITKKTPTHIKGKDMDNREFEIRTVKPFDYQIRKIY